MRLEVGRRMPQGYPELARCTRLNQNGFGPRICRMQPDETILGSRDFSQDVPLALKMETKDSAVDPVFVNQSRIVPGHMRHPIKTDTESFFVEPTDPRQAAWTIVSDVICRLLIWMADGRTLED